MHRSQPVAYTKADIALKKTVFKEVVVAYSQDMIYVIEDSTSYWVRKAANYFWSQPKDFTKKQNLISILTVIRDLKHESFRVYREALRIHINGIAHELDGLQDEPELRDKLNAFITRINKSIKEYESLEKVKNPASNVVYVRKKQEKKFTVFVKPLILTPYIEISIPEKSYVTQIKEAVYQKCVADKLIPANKCLLLTEAEMQKFRKNLEQGIQWEIKEINENDTQEQEPQKLNAFVSAAHRLRYLGSLSIFPNIPTIKIRRKKKMLSEHTLTEIFNHLNRGGNQLLDTKPSLFYGLYKAQVDEFFGLIEKFGRNLRNFGTQDNGNAEARPVSRVTLKSLNVELNAIFNEWKEFVRKNNLTPEYLKEKVASMVTAENAYTSALYFNNEELARTIENLNVQLARSEEDVAKDKSARIQELERTLAGLTVRVEDTARENQDFRSDLKETREQEKKAIEDRAAVQGQLIVFATLANDHTKPAPEALGTLQRTMRESVRFMTMADETKARALEAPTKEELLAYDAARATEAAQMHVELPAPTASSRYTAPNSRLYRPTAASTAGSRPKTPGTHQPGKSTYGP